MQDTLRAKIEDIHVFLYGGLRSLPFALAGTMLLIGLFTSNYAVLFFLIGLLIITPHTTLSLNYAIAMIYNLGKMIASMLGIATDKSASVFDIPYFRTKMTDICKLCIPFSSSKSSEYETVISSDWTAMVAFFVGYVVCNSLQLYNNNITSSEAINSPDAPDTQTKVNKRKTQAMFALISISIFALIAMIFRMNTGCERGIGIIFTSIVFGYLGYLWYNILSSTGEGRLSDIFGIANRLLAPSAIKNGPIACVPIPA